MPPVQPCAWEPNPSSSTVAPGRRCPLYRKKLKKQKKKALKLKKLDEITVLKLGGSLITEKNSPLSIREDVIDNAIKQIIESKSKLILVHGGGSYGHPIAKKYSISGGLNPSIQSQVLGLSETHEAMNELNTIIVKKFLQKKQPILSIQPSSTFFKDSRNIFTRSIELVKSCLDLGVLPVFYGDIIFEKRQSFSIISGDQIIFELCKNLNDYKIDKVIFAIEQDGLFILKGEAGREKAQLAQELESENIKDIKLANLGDKIDVTGGIKGKLEIIGKICELNIPVQIINGLRENFIFKALKNQEVMCSKIVPSKASRTGELASRKLDHLKIPLEYDVQYAKNYFNYVELVHHALPEIDFNDVDLSTSFFNKKISAPICIAAITGGHPLSKEINEILATAAEKEKIIMSVGSQRMEIVDPSTEYTYSVVRKVAPTIPIIGNIGVGQISKSSSNIDDIVNCINSVKADALAIHFNSLHELLQQGGDISYKDFPRKFKEIRNHIKIPLLAKEVGSGLNQELVQALDAMDFDGFDVGGAGGTSFAAIESYRNNESAVNFTRKASSIFREWGIPTPVCVVQARAITNKLIIATGGLKTGIDIAKSISLGADLGGLAYNFLVSAWKDYNEKSYQNTVNEIRTLKNELRSCLWLMNLKNLKELKGNRSKRVILGKLNQWLQNSNLSA